MVIREIQGEFSVCQVQDLDTFDLNIRYCFLGKTEEELSLVCLTEDVPDNTTNREDGWRALCIEGILDFSLVGILAGISGALANEGISLFAVSTWNTDYFLVKQEKLEAARNVLEREGYTIL